MTEWWEKAMDLLDDPMIASCGCDGLLDAYNALKGLFGMSELMFGHPNFTNEFIIDVMNKCIDARNNYCSLNGVEKLENVKMEDFEWHQ